VLRRAGPWCGVLSAIRRQRKRKGSLASACPKPDGAVRSFNQTLKYEHLYQREIDQAGTLAEEVESFRALFNEIRPHESLGQRIPLAVHRQDQQLCGASRVQER
jgi:transposase InsO family protein